jgi:hypothetical protein
MMNRKFRSAASNLRAYRASRTSSYRPYGSDDGYDYHRDNRDGSVDDYVAFVAEWRKKKEEEKSKTPQE